MPSILLPGAHVVRRGADDLQVGLDPREAIVLTDCAPVRATLRLLSAAPAAGDVADATTTRLLEEAGLLVDQGTTSDADAPVSAATRAAVLRASGAKAGEVRRSRGRARIALRGFGHPSGRPLRDLFAALSEAAGIREAGPRRSAPPDCGVLVGVGEPDRELVDGWTRSGTPYVVVRMTEGRAVVGPFVVPGRTACLRCVDAHCADADPRWPLLVRQYAAATRQDRADGATEPVDPLLSALSVAWAARDVASFVDGDQPSSWSATLALHPRLSELETRVWLRHPGCGCS